jgi:hypothetical protein
MQMSQCCSAAKCELSLRAPAAARVSVEQLEIHASTFAGSLSIFEFLRSPRTFMNARQTCNVMSAYACACTPQAIHSTLLRRKSQNPRRRRTGLLDATSHAAATVTAMAGHWINPRSRLNMRMHSASLQETRMSHRLECRLMGTTPSSHPSASECTRRREPVTRFLCRCWQRTSEPEQGISGSTANLDQPLPTGVNAKPVERALSPSEQYRWFHLGERVAIRDGVINLRLPHFCSGL